MPPQLPANSDYQKLIRDIVGIYKSATEQANKAANTIKVRMFWEIGRRIVKEEQKNESRAAYGARLLEQLAGDLREEYGDGFSVTNLKYMRQFYMKNPTIGQTSDQLPWSHQCKLLSVTDDEAREELAARCVKEGLSVRDLTQIIKAEEIPTQEFREPEHLEVETGLVGLLPVKRGKPFLYRIVQQPPAQDLKIDLGFHIYTEIPGGAHPNLSALNIIESGKTREGYSFYPSDAKATSLFTYPALVERVVDGDTILCQIDLGFGLMTRQKLRLKGIDCPELTSTAGQKASEFVKRLLKDSEIIIVKTYASDKYDRYLADIFLRNRSRDPEDVAQTGEFLNQRLLDEGLAKRISY
jgi:endonuclease YncB( thermonuclease family)/predicted nuclease of restriction endonuclease-like (RecB) superfamily